MSLEDGEVILWSKQSSRLRMFVMLLGFFIVVVLAGWMARNQLATATEGTPCATDYCAKPDGKTRLVFLIAPVLGAFLILFMILVLSVKNLWALTNRRMLWLHDAVWRRTPRCTSIRLEDADAQNSGNMIRIRSVREKNEITLQQWTKKADKRFLSAFNTAKKALREEDKK
jgi:hypothetical protein